MATPFVLAENTAAELLAMRLVLSTYMATPDGERPDYHAPAPLHVRAGLDSDSGAKLLALWANRSLWSPTPSYVRGSPTLLGIRWFAQVADSMTPDLWRTWFRGLSSAQLRALAAPLGDRDAVGLDPACGYAWPAYQGVPLLVCPHCGARVRRKDSEPRPLEPVEASPADDLAPLALEDLVGLGCETADQDPTP